MRLVVPVALMSSAVMTETTEGALDICCLLWVEMETFTASSSSRLSGINWSISESLGALAAWSGSKNSDSMAIILFMRPRDELRTHFKADQDRRCHRVLREARDCGREASTRTLPRNTPDKSMAFSECIRQGASEDSRAGPDPRQSTPAAPRIPHHLAIRLI
jgi:hypothetical protein